MNTFNPNYTLNQFMLFYKDKNIRPKNETECLELMKEWRKCFNETFFSLFFSPTLN